MQLPFFTNSLSSIVPNFSHSLSANFLVSANRHCAFLLCGYYFEKKKFKMVGTKSGIRTYVPVKKTTKKKVVVKEDVKIKTT